MRWAPLVAVLGVLGCSGGGVRPGADGGKPPAEAGPPGETPIDRQPDLPSNPPDDEGGLPTSPDADADAVSADAAPPPEFTGRRVFVVTSRLAPAGNAPLPPSHKFTLILDGDAHAAIAGSIAGAGQAPFTTTDGETFQVTGPVGFRLPGACILNLTYDTMTLTPAADGSLFGSATGKVTYAFSDVAMMANVTATFVGVPDTEAPALGTVNGADPADPFVPVSLVTSEPLPPDTKLTLTSGSGDSFVLDATGSAGASLTGFRMPQVLLRFGEPYIIMAPQIVDFAGNKAQTSFQFATGAAPPLVAEDGFEGATGATLGGAQIITGNTNPVIAGSKSLYLAPAPGLAANGSFSQLTLRLAVTAGDTVVRFSYRTVDAQVGAFGGGATYGLGAVGKPVKWANLTASNDPKTPFKLPDGTTVQLGPVNVAQLPLPAGVGNEVFLDRVVGSPAGCGPPQPPPSGVVIDDLRVE